MEFGGVALLMSESNSDDIGESIIMKTANANQFVLTSGNANFIPSVTINQNLTVLSEATIGGISADGTGKAVCIKSNGFLGTCTTAVDATGVCTCS